MSDIGSVPAVSEKRKTGEALSARQQGQLEERHRGAWRDLKLLIQRFHLAVTNEDENLLPLKRLARPLELLIPIDGLLPCGRRPFGSDESAEWSADPQG